MQLSLAFLFSILSAAVQVQALPNGSPVCPLDQSAPGPSHRFDGYQEKGLKAGGIQVFMNGCELKEGRRLSVNVFDPITVTIRGATPFRGVLARFDVDQAIGILHKDRNLQIAGACSALREPAMGVTHTNNDDKDEVSFKVVFMEPVEQINFAVDIVHRNRPEKNRSVFYHGIFGIKSRFNLEGRQCLKNDAPQKAA